MFYSFLGAALVCASALAAEQIDNIEFALPQISSDWMVCHHINNNYGSAIVFAPKEDPNGYSSYGQFYSGDDDDDDSDQSFNAVFHKIPYDPSIDAEQIEGQISLMLPSISYQFYLVERTDDFATLEFYAFDDFGFAAYGVMRKMRSANGTVTLTYATDEEEQVPRMRRGGLEALKQCHALYEP